MTLSSFESVIFLYKKREALPYGVPPFAVPFFKNLLLMVQLLCVVLRLAGDLNSELAVYIVIYLREDDRRMCLTSLEQAELLHSFGSYCVC